MGDDGQTNITVTTTGKRFVVTLDMDCISGPWFSGLAGSMFTQFDGKALLNPFL